MVKDLIDRHIVEYERYYKSICYSYYNGRYLYEDLFQELYIGFFNCKEDVILKFSNGNRLNYLGALILRNLFSKRGYHKKHIDGQTSPLFELSNVSELVDKRIVDEDDEFTKFIDSIPTELIEQKMNELYQKDWFSHDVFKRVVIEDENIYQLSKNTTINRKYLTENFNETKAYLRKQLSDF